MPRLIASTTDRDRIRCLRALLACGDGDKLALDAVLEEPCPTPTGVPGPLFELVDLACGTGEELPGLAGSAPGHAHDFDPDYPTS